MATKKVPLADVLWDAANLWLAPVTSFDYDQQHYSCAAVAETFGLDLIPTPVRQFFESLGCNTDSSSLLHRPWKFTEESQGVRYMWLLLAMHVAEDEQIMVEVPA